ncbi:MAG: hypothetical protein LBG62_05380 [Candidatus Methanoplasma sp.]|jgi:hypothetical protein|nr:hypothetical protein [Candidatus Methanoplasma sp.]
MDELTFSILLFLPAAILSLALGAIIHELARFACGRLSGYGFQSFSVCSLTLSRENGRLRARRTGGAMGGALHSSCQMRPTDRFEDFRFNLYLLGGGVANALVAAAAFALLAHPAVSGGASVAVFAFAYSNAAIAALSLIPMSSLGTLNDGKKRSCASRSPEAARCLWMILRITAGVIDGKRIRDFDASDFELPEGADRYNPLVAILGMMGADRLCGAGGRREVIAVYESTPMDRLPASYRNAALCELLFHYSAVEPDAVKARAIYERSGMKAFLKRVAMPGTLRTLAAYRFFVEGDREAGLKALAAAKDANAKFPHPGIAAAEAETLALLEGRIAEALGRAG